MNQPLTNDRLEDLLSTPSDGVIATLGALTGDLLILGVSGKMGPSLARMARRASDLAGRKRRIFGVARFAGGTLGLEEHGIETIPCDLLNESQVNQLPDAANIVAMTGMKFGSTGQAALTWAVNCYLPALMCRRYPRSRMVVFSTGNVYGLTPVARGGSLETDELHPVGEYAMTAVGRERLLEHFSRTLGIPMAIIRLNYAVDLRYGVPVDIARQILAGQPIDLAMGHFNAIWQGDANAMALQAFAQVSSPPCLLNVTGPEVLSVRRVAEDLSQKLGKPALFQGEAAADALLSNARKAIELFGPPRVSTAQLLAWVVGWVQRGGAYLEKPTHFANREGRF